MKFIKSALLTGAGVIALSLSGAGVASAYSSEGGQKRFQGSHSARTEKRPTNQANAQNTTKQNHADRWAEIVAKRTAKLQQAVASGQITQDQANYITNAWNEIDKIRADTKLSGNKEEAKKQIKQKLDDLKIWAKAQGVDQKFVHLGLWGHHYGWNFRNDHKKSH